MVVGLVDIAVALWVDEKVCKLVLKDCLWAARKVQMVDRLVDVTVALWVDSLAV